MVTENSTKISKQQIQETSVLLETFFRTLIFKRLCLTSRKILQPLCIPNYPCARSVPRHFHFPWIGSPHLGPTISMSECLLSRTGDQLLVSAPPGFSPVSGLLSCLRPAVSALGNNHSPSNNVTMMRNEHNSGNDQLMMILFMKAFNFEFKRRPLYSL